MDASLVKSEFCKEYCNGYYYRKPILQKSIHHKGELHQKNLKKLQIEW
jgi:hypothetical protein